MPMNERLIYVFRHGETDWNSQRRMQGHTDTSLNEVGKEQAQRLSRQLEASGIEAIISSDLRRARQTAQAVADVLNVPVIAMRGLREICVGEVEGLTWQEATEKLGSDFIERMISMNAEFIDTRYPGGESKSELVARARLAIASFIQANDYQCIGVSTHGGVLRVLARSCMDADSEPIAIPNCAVYCFQAVTAPFSLQFLGAHSLEASEDAAFAANV